MNDRASRTILSPFTWLIATAALGLVFDLVLVTTTRIPYTPGFYAFSIVAEYIAACWIWNDSARKRIYFPSDLAFIWFWIGFPAYLYESKGSKGIFIFIGLIMAYLAFAYTWFSISDSIYYSQLQ